LLVHGNGDKLAVRAPWGISIPDAGNSDAGAAKRPAQQPQLQGVVSGRVLPHQLADRKLNNRVSCGLPPGARCVDFASRASPDNFAHLERMRLRIGPGDWVEPRGGTRSSADRQVLAAIAARGPDAHEADRAVLGEAPQRGRLHIFGHQVVPRDLVQNHEQQLLFGRPARAGAKSDQKARECQHVGDASRDHFLPASTSSRMTSA
jgi:hypothetical protein